MKQNDSYMVIEMVGNRLNGNVTIEGEQYDWIDNFECQIYYCKRKKSILTWCDECDVAFCKEHTDYHNDYAEGKTYCPGCWEIEKGEEKLEESKTK